MAVGPHGQKVSVHSCLSWTAAAWVRVYTLAWWDNVACVRVPPFKLGYRVGHCSPSQSVPLGLTVGWDTVALVRVPPLSRTAAAWVRVYTLAWWDNVACVRVPPFKLGYRVGHCSPSQSVPLGLTVGWDTVALVRVPPLSWTAAAWVRVYTLAWWDNVACVRVPPFKLGYRVGHCSPSQSVPLGLTVGWDTVALVRVPPLSRTAAAWVRVYILAWWDNVAWVRVTLDLSSVVGWDTIAWVRVSPLAGLGWNTVAWVRMSS